MHIEGRGNAQFRYNEAAESSLCNSLRMALLFSSTVITQCVRFASAQTFVTIKADGSVSPSTAPIQRVGDLYVLTGDIRGQIFVERGNMTLDGRGHTIQGEVPIPVSSGQILQTTNYGGIYLDSVQNVTVKGFSIKYCSFGVSLDHSLNVTIAGNNITGTWHPFPYGRNVAAIDIWGGNHNIITGNRLENNMYGIYMGAFCTHNIIIGNTISSSTRQGIRLYESSSNTFYHNNFDNSQNVYDSSTDSPRQSASVNDWDNGKEGNFWSDYNGTDADGDGIGDTPHKLYFMNQDNYPLMKPWEPTPIDNTAPIVSIFSPENTTYTVNSLPLSFSTNEPVSWLDYSLDGQDNVTITGNTTLSGLSNGLHNITVYARDEFENTGASETVYFTVAALEPFPIVPLAAASGAAITTVAACAVYYRKKRSH